MRDKLLRALGESGTVRRGDALLLAVSGGADSTALLLALHALREELALSLRVLHVHHGLRGEAAERDADFVRALAARYELPFELVRVDVRRAAREERQSLEEAGRELRYRALFAAAERWEKECGGRVKIATAHTEDDAAETVLLQLARGSGLKGAAGIPAIRGRLVRPLLEVSRAEVEAYLGRRGQNFVEDESNATDSFARNRLRRDILPRFRTDINSEAVRHFARAGRYFREADEYFETLAGEKAQVLVRREGSSVRIARQALLSEPDIVSSYLLRHLLDAVGCARKDISARHLEALRSLAAKEHGKRIALPQGFLAERCGEALVLRRAEEHGKCEPQEKRLPGPEAVTARSFPRTAGAEPPKDPYVQWFDSDKLPKHWEIRTRRSGDKIAMQGGWHKSLRALMTEAKMPLDSRDRLPLLVSETGELIWAVGLRSSAAYWVDDTTTDILELRYEGEKV